MLRGAATAALRRAGRTRVGRSIVHAATMPAPEERQLARVGEWPDELAGFEDLAFLFTSGELNHGIVSLALDEAALLYRLARSARGGTIVEIGRFRGGSTLLLATAIGGEGEIWSYDLHLEPPPGATGEDVDRALRQALERYGLAGCVRLIVGDSRTAPAPPQPCDVVFVDGDHTYEGARADYRRWRGLLRPGGHLLFHDAVARPGYRSHSPEIARLVAEIDGDLERRPGAGSIAHFVRATP